MKINLILSLSFAWFFATVLGEQNLGETAATNGLNTFLALANDTGYSEVLDCNDHLTVFAPSDEAFAKLPPGVLDWLVREENKDTLAYIVGNHITRGLVPSSKLRGFLLAKNSIVGKTLAITSNPVLQVNGATIVKSDLIASNGILYVIDRMLLPRHFDLPAEAFEYVAAVDSSTQLYR